MKKILLASICLLSFASPMLQAMDEGNFSFKTEAEGNKILDSLISTCTPFVKHPVPQYIKEKFINEALRQVPELVTQAKWLYRDSYSSTDNFSFRNIVLEPREREWATIFSQGEDRFFSNYYRVFIGTLCPPDLEEADIAPCIATVSTIAPALVRVDLKEVLMPIPHKGYVSVQEWREYYDKNKREREELIVDDASAIFPEKWING